MGRNSNNHAPPVDDVEQGNSAEGYGTIARLLPDKGFGFIKAFDADGTPRLRNVFFHRSTCYGMHFESLNEGDQVRFYEGQENDKGPRAERVWMA
jgi:cold shock CspA family protein